MADLQYPVEVRAGLARVLASEGFRSSPRLSRFLQYLVEASLNGSPLKEYSIGIDVFEKPSSFEPRSDSTVRGEASKLRMKLRLYYETAGTGDPILIEIPKGGYSAAFRARRQHKISRWPMFAGLAIVAIIGPIVWWAARPGIPPQSSLWRITNDVGLTAFPSVSAGGDLVAFASDRSGRGDLDVWIQPVGGGDARRLTDDPADDYDPHFSPDGSRIAFRSERQGGGIYAVPAMGGTAYAVAPRGRQPRYSPDGAWIAYSVGTTRLIAASAGSGHMFVVPAGGGAPRPLQPQFLAAHHPIWSPDGKHLLFLGRPSNPTPSKLDLDWWVTPVAGGQAIKTGAMPELAQLHLNPPVWSRVALSPSAWSPDFLLFSSHLKDTTSLWKLPFSSGTFRVTGQAERLTFGSGSQVSASLTPSRDIVFADVRDNYEIWSIPIDADRGQVKGPLERLTHNVAIDRWPSISRDGRRLVYLSFRSGSPEVWLKELDTGRETPLTTDGAPKDWPEIAPDGSSYYFTRTVPPGDIWWAKLHAAPKRLCADCQTLTLLPDGSGFLHSNISPPFHPHLMDAGGRSSSWLRHPTWNLHQPQLSPDGAWVVFYASLAPERTRIYIARFRKDAPPPPAEWTAITEGEFLETTPLWSPGGNRLYFGSNRDDFQCVWSVVLDPASKRAAGPPAPIAHFHNATQQMGNVGLTRRGMSVARDRIVFPLVERAGNLWMMKPR